MVVKASTIAKLKEVPSVSYGNIKVVEKLLDILTKRVKNGQVSCFAIACLGKDQDGCPTVYTNFCKDDYSHSDTLSGALHRLAGVVESGQTIDLD